VSTDNLSVSIGNVTHTLTVTQDVGVAGEGGSATTGAYINFVIPGATLGGVIPEFFGATFPQGLVFTESLFLGAIGDETNVVTTNDVRTYVIYRVAEVRAA
jgi:hypothetical protein